MYDPHFVIPDLNTHSPANAPSRIVFADSEGHVLCYQKQPFISETVPEFLRVETEQIFIGSSPDANYRVSRIPPGGTLPEGYAALHLRSIAHSISRDLLGTLGRAIQLVRFDLTTTYCGRCGTETRLKEDEFAKLCPSCGLLTFPRLSPAIIVRITDGDRILLASSPGFPSDMYSVLAGFVEPGESLEACVHREVYEEVGVRVSDIRYFGSQPWPFPDSLMIGFTARYVSGEIQCDGVEIADARWFTRDQMPTLPGQLSISFALIDDFLKS